LLFPGTQGLRYAFPVLPILLIFFINGYLALTSIHWKRFAVSVSAITVIFIIVSGFFLTYKSYKVDTNKVITAEAIEVYKYISNNIPDNGIIIFHKPRLLRLMTGRNSIFINNIEQVCKTDAGSLLDYTENNDYPADIYNSNKIVSIYETQKFRLYKIKRNISPIIGYIPTLL
jgi:hypothetical protein